jgi:hypothetical protein
VDVLVYATAPPPDQLVIFTSAPLAYAITPRDQSAFIEEFKVRRRLGPVQSLRHETVRPAPLQRAIWSDIFTLRLLVLAAVLNALLFGLIAWRYPGLPAKLALQFRFDALAHPVPAALRPRNVIWTLPAVGLGAIGLNAVLAVIVHPRARLGAALLVVGVVLLQVIIGVALIRIL